MTAPLPPIPFGTGTDDIRAQLESYAKLAVREALERVVVGCDNYAFVSAKYIRAMIKEYK